MIFLFILFIVAPFLFLDYPSVIKAIRNEARTIHLGADNLGWLGNLWYYVQTFYELIGIVGGLLCIIGGYAFIRWFSKESAFLLYGLFYWVVMSKLALHWERWALPMYIAPLFLIVMGISYMLDKKEKHTLTVRLVGGLLVSLFMIQQSVYSAYIPIQKKFIDTRVISNDYCELNEINRNNTIYEGYTPLEPNYPTKIFPTLQEKIPKKKYIILSSTIYNRYYAEPDRYQDEIETYAEIRKGYP